MDLLEDDYKEVILLHAIQIAHLEKMDKAHQIEVVKVHLLKALQIKVEVWEVEVWAVEVVVLLVPLLESHFLELKFSMDLMEMD
jgi:hypothetical protein